MTKLKKNSISISIKTCQTCGNYTTYELNVGDIWINSNKFKVQILDFGLNDVWVLYLSNKNRCGWAQKDFINQYKLYKKGV